MTSLIIDQCSYRDLFIPSLFIYFIVKIKTKMTTKIEVWIMFKKSYEIFTRWIRNEEYICWKVFTYFFVSRSTFHLVFKFLSERILFSTRWASRSYLESDFSEKKKGRSLHLFATTFSKNYFTYLMQIAICRNLLN